MGVEKPSPGRYSLATEGSTEMAAVRIDSMRMNAVRPEDIAAHERTRSETVLAAQAKATRNSSLRPPPPSSKRDSRPPLFDGVFDGFDEGSLAHAFDTLLEEGSGDPSKQPTFDLAPVRDLFAALAANHMRHVRDFMIDVKWGDATRAWIAVCIPAVTSLRRAAERLDLAELVTGLDNLGLELESAASVPAPTVEGPSKERLLAAYEELTNLMPQAFSLDRDKSQREAVIVQSLLLSVPDVRKVTIDKLYAAGLMSLTALFDADVDEVAAVAGIPSVLAASIVERFQAYRHELANASPEDARAAERDRLSALNERLKEQNHGYDEASQGWSPDAKAKKRELFRAREDTWLAITVILARFGEVERLQGIEKVPFGQRIALLSEYLEEARDKYRMEI